jgi:hypothetical protein
MSPRFANASGRTLIPPHTLRPHRPTRAHPYTPTPPSDFTNVASLGRRAAPYTRAPTHPQRARYTDRKHPSQPPS